MAVYTNLNTCCLDSKGWLWIKTFDVQKDGLHTTSNLRESYEGDNEVNKRVSWATENIDNNNFTSKHIF